MTWGIRALYLLKFPNTCCFQLNNNFKRYDEEHNPEKLIHFKSVFYLCCKAIHVISDHKCLSLKFLFYIISALKHIHAPSILIPKKKTVNENVGFSTCKGSFRGFCK